MTQLFEHHLKEVEVPGFYDFKTRLQERAQARYKITPEYRVVREYGPDHDKTFVVSVALNGRELARAGGKSKKEAEQNAAANALFLMDGAYGDWFSEEDGQ